MEWGGRGMGNGERRVPIFFRFFFFFLFFLRYYRAWLCLVAIQRCFYVASSIRVHLSVNIHGCRDAVVNRRTAMLEAINWLFSSFCYLHFLPQCLFLSTMYSFSSHSSLLLTATNSKCWIINTVLTSFRTLSISLPSVAKVKWISVPYLSLFQGVKALLRIHFVKSTPDENTPYQLIKTYQPNQQRLISAPLSMRLFGSPEVIVAAWREISKVGYYMPCSYFGYVVSFIFPVMLMAAMAVDWDTCRYLESPDKSRRLVPDKVPPSLLRQRRINSLITYTGARWGSLPANVLSFI